MRYKCSEVGVAAGAAANVEWSETMQESGPRLRTLLGSALTLVTVGVAGSALLVVGEGVGSADESAKDSCVECHSNADFLVTHKKLHDYYQLWKESTHALEGVSCADCHGGDPEVSDKKAAHGGDVGGEDGAGSAVNFRNLPETCGTCHDEISEGFRESDHFDHLVRKKQDKQGPSCVTCHGSLNVEVLNVNTVEEACARCHSEEKDNHPDIPEKAEVILNRFLSIHRYYRYISKRGDPAETQIFFKKIDADVQELSVLWHTFDLPKIEEKTAEVLDRLKAKRVELREREKQAQQAR
jgi:nitrate/TMAO reductase-like tetraheme cytochrome c subunit